eukprot:scaffold7340_cov266-Pinguiococcus_pyrenoidosus.AAC.34
MEPCELRRHLQKEGVVRHLLKASAPCHQAMPCTLPSSAFAASAALLARVHWDGTGTTLVNLRHTAFPAPNPESLEQGERAMVQ